MSFGTDVALREILTQAAFLIGRDGADGIKLLIENGQPRPAESIASTSPRDTNFNKPISPIPAKPLTSKRRKWLARSLLRPIVIKFVVPGGRRIVSKDAAAVPLGFAERD
jgi:hypothetical protein